MELTVKQIIDASEALQKLGKQKIKCKDSGKIIYAISKNIGVIDPQIIAYQKSRESLLKNFKTKLINSNDGPKLIFENRDEGQEFEKQHEVILSEKIELDIRQIVLPMPGEDEEPLIDGVDLYLLEWMVTFEGVEY